jgi:superfamily II DNA/RNA helicase
MRALCRCAIVAGELRARGFDVAAMSSTLTQDERLRTLKKLQLFQIRILVTTDLVNLLTYICGE